MRIVLLCAATFLGGILAGAVLWPSSAPREHRTPEPVREAPGSLPRDGFERAGPWEAGGSDEVGSAADNVPRGDTRLRDLTGEAGKELARVLARPAAQAFLEGDGTVTGSVRDLQGEPVAGVIVTASPEAQPFDLAVAARRARERAHEDVDLDAIARDAIQGELWRREVRRTARTDSDGHYEIKDLVKGWHRVTAFHDDYDLQPDPRNNRVQPDAVVDFRAQPVASVPVEVRLPDGRLADYGWLSWQGAGGNGWDSWVPEPGTVRLPKVTCRVKAQTWMPEPLQSAEVEYDAGSADGPLVLELEGRRVLTARLVPAEGLSVPDGVDFKLRRLEGRADVDPESLKGDQGRGGQATQGRATWYDLDPGRYLIAAFLGGSHLLAHAVAEMGEGSTDVDLPFEAPPPGTYVTAKLLVPEGGSAQGSTRFAVITGSGERTRHHGADALKRVDGEWLVLLPELPADAQGEALLRVSTGGYGSAQESFDPRRPGTVTFRFREPARLRLLVERFSGSGVEGRLFAALWGDEGTVSARQIEADGRCDLGTVQPKDYSLILFVRDGGTRWSILTRRITLRAGEQEETMRVPALHTLRVRPAPNLRARDVTLTCSDPVIGWMRRTERLQDGVAAFDALAGGAYEVHCGNKRMEVRLPGPDEVTIQ